MLLGDLNLDGSPAMHELDKLDQRFDESNKKHEKGNEKEKESFGKKVLEWGAVAGEVIGVMEGLKEAMNLGGELNDLSLRSGETVHDLVIMREAFQEAGLGAEGVEPFLLKLQNALGGVNDEGEKTSDALDALKLSGDELGKMSGLEQIEALQKGFSELDQNTRVQVARNLFGKSGGTSLSLLGDPKVIEDARKYAEPLANVMDRVSGSFDKLGDIIGAGKNAGIGFFAGALEQIAPNATTLADKLASIDFVSIGEGFGTITTYVVNLAGWLVKAGEGLSSFVDKFAEMVLGKQAPELVEYNKSLIEYQRRRNGESSKDALGDKSPVGALQKIGLGGGFGGGGDPLLAENQRQTSLLQQLVDLQRRPMGTGGALDPVPV